MPAELSEKGLSAWLDELPLANVEVSGQSLLTLLRMLNQIESFASGEHLGLLERLRATVYMLADRAIEMHLRGDVTFPLPRVTRRSAGLGYLLCREFGRAYLRVASGKSFYSERALDKAARQRCLYRALEAYGEMQLKYQAIYLPVPHGYWREVYGLYAAAEQRGWHAEKIAGVKGERSGDTILAVFKHILLFSLAHCQRYRPLEIRQIHEVTGRFAHLAELNAEPRRADESAAFSLDLGGDEPPRPIQAGPKGDDAKFRFLLTRTLVRQALAYYGEAESRRWSGIRMRRTMLKRLIQSLAAPERRKSSRLPSREERTLTLGLENLALAMTGDDRGPVKSAPKRATSVVQVRGVTLLDVPDYTLQLTDRDERDQDRRDMRSETSIGQRWRGEQSKVRQDDIWTDRGLALSPGRNPAIPLAWTVNASAHGYCLCWVSKELSCVRVDELIGVPDEDGNLNVGVVRWLSHDSEDNLLLGVELLSPASTPVAISVSGSFEDERHGLLLPVNKRLGASSSLITPPASFQLGQIVRLETAGHSRNCRLERLIESNFSFSHFGVVGVEG
ncbi:hypothetical protein [Methylococcus sp. EFPC2]|uniref:hypothetical protein n=1 Tax=Methylococcus sp. EFPC2 TaxID=2812648 RepID=UPI001967F89B|nr:hypothetical protein [Methylococcus sp. EFPC2]QSA96281.1 hypothetical protein JWZ97_13755 [Methylococcus sp. EFPC2]